MAFRTRSHVAAVLPTTSTRLGEALLHSSVRAAMHIMYRLRKTNLDAVPATGPALLVCNHVSFVDALVVAAAFRRPVRFVMDHRIYASPWLNWVFRAGGVIPIAPRSENPALTEAAFTRTASALAGGELVCIFPEGKITYDGSLNPFRAGVQRIVADSPVPVIPMALRGLWGSFFSRRFGSAMSHFPRRAWSRIELRCGAALEPHRVTADSLATAVANLC